MCPGENGMTDELRNIFLNVHNQKRSFLALGKAKNGGAYGGYAPKAKKMLKMIYDCDIEENTMQFVKKCVARHSPGKDRPGLGQNLWELPVHKWDWKNASAWAVDDWFAELEQHGFYFENNNTILTMENFAGVGHWTQVVWQNSYKLGCGIWACPDMTLVACEYGPVVDEGLCVHPPKVSITPEQLQKQLEEANAEFAKEKQEGLNVGPPPTEAPKFDAHCSLDNGMTDEVRQKFLDKHNEYRSLVAKGEAKNGLGGFTPKAARMPKLSYDCDAEVNAMSWIKNCKYEAAPWDDLYGANGLYGENIWMSPDNKMDKISAADASISSWFSALEKFSAGQDNTFTRADYFSGAGNYTQIVWQSTLKLGCGAVSCDSMTLVACHYTWAGNFVGGKIYETGEPCKTNADCMCTGCTCLVDEALCAEPS
ncbi:SCP-like protein [Teladorsagia circumcincta]|uniref:SCP-like protein n=1 Tax=Teladorsagia circumcincta TaxID=45464 RepID=A0A2G9UU99_TELCI|nr:SCP-like protein [Teladorsagia circumcincta]